MSFNPMFGVYEVLSWFELHKHLKLSKVTRKLQTFEAGTSNESDIVTELEDKLR